MPGRARSPAVDPVAAILGARQSHRRLHMGGKTNARRFRIPTPVFLDLIHLPYICAPLMFRGPDGSTPVARDNGSEGRLRARPRRDLRYAFGPNVSTIHNARQRLRGHDLAMPGQRPDPTGPSPSSKQPSSPIPSPGQPQRPRAKQSPHCGLRQNCQKNIRKARRLPSFLRWDSSNRVGVESKRGWILQRFLLEHCWRSAPAIQYSLTPGRGEFETVYPQPCSL